LPEIDCLLKTVLRIVILASKAKTCLFVILTASVVKVSSLCCSVAEVQALKQIS